MDCGQYQNFTEGIATPSRGESLRAIKYPELLNNIEQSFNPERFGQHGRCASQRTSFIIPDRNRNYHDRNSCKPTITRTRCQKPPSIEHRHSEVEDNQLGKIRTAATTPALRHRSPRIQPHSLRSTVRVSGPVGTSNRHR
jgi:hypothetical protein